MSKIILDNSNNTAVTNNESNLSSDNIELKKQAADEFAVAFPEWNLVPPFQVIKRVRRSL